MMARLCQRFLRLSVPPKRVVKWVESIRTMSPARWPVGDIQISALNSLLPAAVNGWGRLGRRVGDRAPVVNHFPER